MKLKRKEAENLIMLIKCAYKNFIFIFIAIIIGCKKTEAKTEFSVQPKLQNSVSDTLYFYQVNPFKEKIEGVEYEVDKFLITYKNVENEFTIIEEKKTIGSINFDGKDFDGVGYNIFLYKTPKSEIKFIIFEALADIGTAWYYVVMLKNNKIVNKFYIKEPRANSDNISLNEFLSIGFNKSDYFFKFNKKHIANYSIIPKDLKSDKQYVYQKASIFEEETSSSLSDNSIANGMYSIKTDVESITTGETISLKFNFYIYDDGKMNLRISTDSSEEAYCEGSYKLISGKKGIKAIYEDEGICTDNLEENAFYLKQENKTLYIKSKRFLNTNWQELKKE